MFQFHFWTLAHHWSPNDSKHVEGRKCKTHPIQTGSGSQTRRTQEELQHLTPLWLKLRLDRKCLSLYCGVCCSLSVRPTQRQPAQQHSPTESSARWIISASVALRHNPSLLVIYITIRLLLLFLTSHCISQYFIPCSCTTLIHICIIMCLFSVCTFSRVLVCKYEICSLILLHPVCDSVLMTLLHSNFLGWDQ